MARNFFKLQVRSLPIRLLTRTRISTSDDQQPISYHPDDFQLIWSNFLDHFHFTHSLTHSLPSRPGRKGVVSEFFLFCWPKFSTKKKLLTENFVGKKFSEKKNLDENFLGKKLSTKKKLSIENFLRFPTKKSLKKKNILFL